MAPTRGNLRALLGQRNITRVQFKERPKERMSVFSVPYWQVEEVKELLEPHRPFGIAFVVKPRRFWHNWRWTGYDQL